MRPNPKARSVAQWNKIVSIHARRKKAKSMAKGRGKIRKVIGEYERGTLHSGSKKGPVVTNPKQAKAIALSEARKAGARIPKRGK